MENIYINDRVFFEDFKSSKVIYGELKDITMRANRSLVYVVESNDTTYELKANDIIASMQVYRNQR